MDTRRGYWRIWAATFVFFGGFYALVVPLPRYLTSIGLADWEIGLVLGTFGVASLIGRPVAGVAVDRAGARPVLLGGAGALLCGALGIATTTNLAMLIVLRLLQAVGYVAFTTAGTALVVQLSPAEQRGHRLALFGIAANVAITLTPAAMSALLLVVPLTAGFMLAGGLALLAGLLVLPRAAFPAMLAATRAPITWRPPHVLWLPMLLAGLFGAAFAAFFQFVPLLAERRGDIAAGWLYTVYGVGIIGTRIISGRVLDRTSTERLLRGSALAMALGLGLIALNPPVSMLLFAILLLASGSGVFHPALIAHHAELLPASPGQATAAFYIGFDLGIGLGSWLFGVLLQTAGFTGLYASAALLVILVLPLTARMRNRKNDDSKMLDS